MSRLVPALAAGLLLAAALPGPVAGNTPVAGHDDRYPHPTNAPPITLGFHFQASVPGWAQTAVSNAWQNGWDDPAGTVSKPYGEAWHRDQRSAILIVPSVVARLDRNILINLIHPDAAKITSSMAEPIWWDKRLFLKNHSAP